MVNVAEVLDLINHDPGIDWKCSPEQRGHVYLIVKVDSSGICLSDALGEKLIDKFRVDIFFKISEECVPVNKARFFEAGWNISFDLGLLDSFKGFSEIVLIIALIALGLRLGIIR